jgi:hypothetical protein
MSDTYFDHTGFYASVDLDAGKDTLERESLKSGQQLALF